MELTNFQIERIKAAARDIDYGSVTINIAADKPNRLELSVNSRLRIENEPTEHKAPLPGREFGTYKN